MFKLIVEDKLLQLEFGHKEDAERFYEKYKKFKKYSESTVGELVSYSKNTKEYWFQSKKDAKQFRDQALGLTSYAGKIVIVNENMMEDKFYNHVTFLRVTQQIDF